MATPAAPASISLSEVNTELGRSASLSINLNDTGVRNLAGVQSGAVSLSNLRNKQRVPQTFEWEGVGGGGSGSGGSVGGGGGAGKYVYGIAATLNYGPAGTTFEFQVGGSDTLTQSVFGTLQAGGNGGSQTNYNYNGGPGFGGGGGQGGQRSSRTQGGSGQNGGFPGGQGTSYNQGPGYGGGGGGGYNSAGGQGIANSGGGAGGATISTIRGTTVSGGGTGASNLGQPSDAAPAYSGRGGEGGNAGVTAGGSGYFCVRCTENAAIAVTTGSPTVTLGGGNRTYFFSGTGTLQWA